MDKVTRQDHQLTHSDIDALLAALEPAEGAAIPALAAQPSTRTRGPPSRIQPKGYSLETIPSAPGSGVATPADESVILTRGPDIMAIGEFTNAFDSVAADLERMWKGYKEGRGGAREAGVRDLVSRYDTISASARQADNRIVETGRDGFQRIDAAVSQAVARGDWQDM